MPRAPPNLFRSCARQQPASTDSCTPPNHRFRMAGSPFAQGRAADHGPRYATCGGRTGSKVSQIAVTDQLLLMPNGKGMSVGKHIKPVRDIGDLPVKVVGEQDPFRVFFFVDQSFERGHMPRCDLRERLVQQHELRTAPQDQETFQQAPPDILPTFVSHSFPKSGNHASSSSCRSPKSRSARPTVSPPGTKLCCGR